jgi:hypothetical protein
MLGGIMVISTVSLNTSQYSRIFIAQCLYQTLLEKNLSLELCAILTQEICVTLMSLLSSYLKEKLKQLTSEGSFED